MEKTLREVASFVSSVMASEESAQAHGLLQGIDPRVKLITGLALVILTSLTHRIPIFLGALIVFSVLAAASRVKVREFLARVWIPALFFGGAVALPAAVNVFVPGDPLVILWRTSGREVAITFQGLVSALTLILRIAVSIAIVTLILMTTKWQEIIRGLQVLGVPQALVLILAVTYRYIHLFVRLLESKHLANMSRTIMDPDAPGGQRAAASAAGALLKKYSEMSGQIYSAMVSRGFKDI